MRLGRRGSLTPVPERLWAARNVANNLMRFGEPLQVGEAVALLEEAGGCGLACGHGGGAVDGHLFGGTHSGGTVGIQ